MRMKKTAEFQIDTPAIKGSDFLAIGQAVPGHADMAIEEGAPDCEWLVTAEWTEDKPSNGGYGQVFYPPGVRSGTVDMRETRGTNPTYGYDYEGPYGSGTQER